MFDLILGSISKYYNQAETQSVLNINPLDHLAHSRAVCRAAGDRVVEGGWKHLCDTCKFNFAECDGQILLWSIDIDPTSKGADADMVLKCLGHKQKDEGANHD